MLCWLARCCHEYLFEVIADRFERTVSCKFLSAAAAFLAISPWSTAELHSALALKVRTSALSPAQADAVLQSFERHLAPGILLLDLDPQDFLNANACLRS